MGEILDRAALASRIARLKSEGKRAVFTNGCFDILHVGHVRYLKQARALGDLLIIGLNSDASVGMIKPGRPIVAQAERAEMLASLCMVDFVTLFDEQTPYELIKAVRPDVLVKGGDWKPADIVGSDLVPDTRSLPFSEGYSTSGIIRKILSTQG